MRKTITIIAVLLVGCLLTAQAQNLQIKGKITAVSDGLGIPGASVQLKGTTIGAITDADGNYTLSLPAEATTLIVSSVGYSTIEVSIDGRSVVDVPLQADVVTLDEVVVTAIGIKKEQKALGYAIQKVDGEDITKARETNLVNSLQGKVAGAWITNTSGAVGASSRIVLRGTNSLSGNNQPLFVVDGIPISNSIFGDNTTEGTNRGNGASDINPDDIENISVLKGANAAALYGSRASNGVILITTKKGAAKKGLGISFNNTTTFETPLKLPSFQNKYGQGNNGQFSFVDGAGGGINDGSDESWGPQLDIGLLIPQFDSPLDANGDRTATPWVSHPDNVKNFYETGRTITTNLAITGGGENNTFRLSLTNLDQKGTLPNTDLKRNTFSLNASTRPFKGFEASVSGNYINTKSENTPGYGYDAQNVVQQLNGWFGRQVDISELKNYKNADGSKFNWNYSYHNNPYFTLYENLKGLKRDRLFGNGKISYEFTDWFSAFARTGIDYYTNLNSNRVAAGDIETPTGSYTEEVFTTKEITSDFLLLFHKKVSDFDLSLNGGGSRFDYTYQDNWQQAAELVIPGVYTIANSAVAIQATNEFDHKRINSLYFDGQIGYRNALYLGFTGRNDWSSTLPSNNNSYFYPSVTLSAVLSEILPFKPQALDFAKVRVSYAQVGSDTDPYQLSPKIEFGDGWNASTKLLNTFVPNTLPNSNLKPQYVNSFEVGAELKFFLNRVRLDFTYYNSISKDQILTVPISGASGYLAKVINAGEITNNGFEVQLGLTPISIPDGLKWDIDFNYASNKNEVVSLADGIDNIQLGSYWNAQILAIPGQSYGAIYGYDFKRDPNGNIINENGLPVQGDLKVLGNYTPDWIGSVNNNFTYKGLNLGFLIDARIGGDVYSMTNSWGRYSGLLEETLIGREGGIVGVGVKEVTDANGNVTYATNDVVVTAEEYNKASYSNSIVVSSVFDASYVKFREAHIGYNFGKIGNAVQNFTVSLVGRNLAILYSKVPHIDPETSFGNGNVQGLEFGQIPSNRSYGFNISLNF